MKSCFGYIRVSTTRQGQGVSLIEQKSAIEAFAKRSNLEIISWFEDQETAAKQGRRMFGRMMADLKRSKAQGVVIHKIDRGARNFRDWADIGELIDRGIEVHFAHDAIDLSSRGGRLSADIQAVVAADYIRNLREETRKGFYGRLKQGLYPLAAPLGYVDKGRGHPKEIDPVKGPLVRAAFDLYATGEWNFERLQAEMQRRGLRSRFGGPVSMNGLTTLLNNPFYIGLIHIRKTNEAFDGIHPPLIPKSLYDRVQTILRSRKDGSVPYRHAFLFRRLMHCAGCKAILTGERQKGRYIYYRCHTRGCGVASVNENIVDDRWRDLLPMLTLNAEDLGDLRDLLEKLRSNNKDEAEIHAQAIQLLLAQCNDRLTRLTDALVDGLIDKATFDGRNAALLREKRDYIERLDMAAEVPTCTAFIEKYLELSNTAQLSYETAIPEEMRRIVSALTSNFSVEGKYPVIALKSPYQEIVEMRIHESCDPKRDAVRTQAAKIFELMKFAAEAEVQAYRSRQNTTAPKPGAAPPLDMAA